MEFLNTLILKKSYKYFRYLFILASCFLLPSCLTTTVLDPELQKSQKLFTPDEQRQDLAFIDRSIQQVHPEPFARISKQEYQSLYNQLYLDLSWPLKRTEFFRKVAPLVSLLSDIHTQLAYSSYEFNREIEKYGKFPLILLNTSDGLIVIADQQRTPSIPTGAKLISINEIPINTILQEFQSQIPFETETGQRRTIQVEFSRLLWSSYADKTESSSEVLNTYDVEYLWQGQRKTQNVIGVTTKTSKTLNNTSYYGAIEVDKNTTLLWFNDFNENKQVLSEFLEKTFTELKQNNIKNIILDLRYNKGGYLDNIALLLSYLSRNKLQLKSTARLKLSEAFRSSNVKLLENKKSSKYGDYLDWLPIEYLNLWQWEVLFADDGEFLEFDIDPMSDQHQSTFDGHLYVLTNGYCFSACATLVNSIHKLQIATIIGEVPGSISDVQYGFPVEMKLPNTGLKLTIPAMKIESMILDDKKDELLDIQIERLAEDVLNGTDSVLDKAMQLINNE